MSDLFFCTKFYFSILFIAKEIVNLITENLIKHFYMRRKVGNGFIKFEIVAENGIYNP